MTSAYRQLPLSRLGHLVPPLVQGQALVALVAATADRAWSAKAAWDIARIAARDGGGRRVALVDLRLDDPSLHETVGLDPGDGVVDSFEYGVSLAKAAREVDGVFFISAGSDTASPQELYAHARWRKLHAGFRHEGALLLVYVSPAGLAQLSAVTPPDGAIVLEPEGLAPGSMVAAQVAIAVERGTALLGVARDRWTPAPRDAGPVVAPLFSPGPARRPRSRVARAVVVGLGLATLGVGGWVLLAGARESAVSAGDGAAAAAAPAPPPPALPADTLGWTIQLAAYGTLERALAHADRLAEDILALVTPVPQEGAGVGPVWYRVVAGSYASRDAAAAARDTLWRRGLAPRGIGDLLYAPYSFTLANPSAADSVAALRARAVPAVRVASTPTILIGAFESRDQAAFTQAALARAGVRAVLLPRLGQGHT